MTLGRARARLQRAREVEEHEGWHPAIAAIRANAVWGTLLALARVLLVVGIFAGMVLHLALDPSATPRAGARPLPGETDAIIADLESGDPALLDRGARHAQEAAEEETLDPRAAPALLAVLEASPTATALDRRVRLATALAELSDPRARSGLERLYATLPDEARRQAQRAFAQDPGQPERVAEALREEARRERPALHEQALGQLAERAVLLHRGAAPVPFDALRPLIARGQPIAARVAGRWCRALAPPDPDEWAALASDPALPETERQALAPCAPTSPKEPSR